MLLAIVLGTVGYLCAIFLTILAGYGLMHTILAAAMEAMGPGIEASGAGFFLGMETGTLFLVLVVMAVMRGILHYGEQYCNHFIAFKLLAIIRHKVFAALRKLCPAKLEGRDKGNLISVITSDIELLEVFYAHSLSDIFPFRRLYWRWRAISQWGQPSLCSSGEKERIRGWNSAPVSES